MESLETYNKSSLPLPRKIYTLRNAIRNSSIGWSLKATNRFAERFFEPGRDNYRNWREVLGPFSNTAHHQDYFNSRMFDFIVNEGLEPSFSRESLDLLLVGSQVHDLGESIFLFDKWIGDLPAGSKTEEIEKLEFEIGLRTIQELDISNELKAQTTLAYKVVVMGEQQDKYPDTHKYFKMFETLDYVDVVTWIVVGWILMDEGSRSENWIVNEYKLLGRVLAFDLTKLISVYLKQFPNTINYLLRKESEYIDKAFYWALLYVNNSPRYRHLPDNEKYGDKLAEARRIWWSWKTSKNN